MTHYLLLKRVLQPTDTSVIVPPLQKKNTTFVRKKTPKKTFATCGIVTMA